LSRAEAGILVAVLGLCAGTAVSGDAQITWEGPEVRASAAPAATGSAPGAAQATADTAGEIPALHVARDKPVVLPHTMTDGAGFLWDISNYGCVGNGTNHAFGYGMRLRVNGAYVYTTSPGWIDQDGDEIEIARTGHCGMNVARRVKVYKDAGLARWLDVYENPTDKPITVQVLLRTHTDHAVGRVVTSGGYETFGDQDWALVAEPQADPDKPPLLLVLGDGRGDVRPSVQVQGALVTVTYQFTLPAGQTGIVCCFLSQGKSADEQVKRMRSFQAPKYVSDLPLAVRRRIVNLAVSGEFLEGLSLDRSASSDSIVLNVGDSIFGEVANKRFTIETVFGKVTLEASSVVGMAAVKDSEGAVRALLTDGQIVTGRLAPEERLTLRKPSGELSIPLARIRQWSYRLAKERPREIAFAGPYVLLRTGDRLAFDANSLKVAFSTKHGVLALDGRQLLRIHCDGEGASPHRALFMNGSSLSGTIQPEKIAISLRLTGSTELARWQVQQVQFAPEGRMDGGLTRMILRDEDTLLGRLSDEKLTLKTDYGVLDVRPDSIRSIVFDPDGSGSAAVCLRNHSVVRGRLGLEALGFRIVPGPDLKVNVNQCAGVYRAGITPCEEVRKEVEKLLWQLHAESPRDRQTAGEMLVRLGPGALPVLQRHLRDEKDAEARAQVEEIIDRLGGRSAQTRPVGPPRLPPHGPPPRGGPVRADR
jgi:hypothetical protein